MIPYAVFMAHADNLPHWPRWLGADLAAKYVGLGKTKFLAGVKAGHWPKPIEYDSRRLWDRPLLDAAADRLAGYENSPEERLSDEDGPNPWDGAVA